MHLLWNQRCTLPYFLSLSACIQQSPSKFEITIEINFIHINTTMIIMRIIIAVDSWHWNKASDMKISINWCVIQCHWSSPSVGRATHVSDQEWLDHFVFFKELIKVLRPGEFEKDTFLLNDEEKRNQIPVLKIEGNDLYNAGQFDGAASKYGQALQFFEELMLK